MARAVWSHPANRRARMRSLARLLGWQFVKHLLRRPVDIRFHGHKLRCFPDSTSTSGALYFRGWPDWWEMKFLQAYLRPGDNFLDIGANSGVYSILAGAYVGAQGHIDAFEPSGRTASRIEEQAALNGFGNITVHRLAVSDRDGELDFGYSNADATMHLRRDGEAEAGGSRVRSTSLDAFAPYLPYAAGKMDIEGAEPLAMQGAAQRLRDANPPVWQLELAGYSNLYGVTSDEFVWRLSAAGYDCAVFAPAEGVLEYTETPWNLGVQNVLAISRRHKAKVEERLASNPTEHR